MLIQYSTTRFPLNQSSTFCFGLVVSKKYSTDASCDYPVYLYNAS